MPPIDGEIGVIEWAATVRRRIRRFASQFWEPITVILALQALVIASVAMVGSAAVAIAGDTNPQGGNGDCWRSTTPFMCRTTWTGSDSYIHMRIIDQIGDGTLHNAAGTACANWNSAPGPQYCSWNPVTNDTWTYLKLDTSLPAPNGVTLNCVNGACPTSDNAGDILWSEIYVPLANRVSLTNVCGKTAVWAEPIFAHELGHAYGLAHHGSQCSNVTLMTQASSFQGPTNIDIGPYPPCSTGAGNGGMRCIYEDTDY